MEKVPPSEQTMAALRNLLRVPEILTLPLPEILALPS